MRSQASPVAASSTRFRSSATSTARAACPSSRRSMAAAAACSSDSTSNAVSTLVLDGAATLDAARCSTQAVDLGLAGAAVIRATSKTSCANVAERDHRALPRGRARRHDAASRRRCIADRWLDVREAARHAAPQRHGRRRLPCDHGRHDADRRDLRARRRRHGDRRRARGRRGARGRRVVRCEQSFPLRGFGERPAERQAALDAREVRRLRPGRRGCAGAGEPTRRRPTPSARARATRQPHQRCIRDGFRIGVRVRVRDTNPPSAGRRRALPPAPRAARSSTARRSSSLRERSPSRGHASTHSPQAW